MNLDRCLQVLSAYPDRAQHRIAQQREEHAMPLSQILDIRKHVFTQIKVYKIKTLSFL